MGHQAKAVLDPDNHHGLDTEARGALSIISYLAKYLAWPSQP